MLVLGLSVNLIVGIPVGVTAKAISAALAPPRRIVALPSPWIVQRRSCDGPWGCGVAAFSSAGLIGPSTRVSTTPGSPRTTSVESSKTVMVCGSALLTSMTTGARPAKGGGSIQASIRLPAAAATAEPPRQSKAEAKPL